MRGTMSRKKSWKPTALLIILLSHAVFGSPVLPQASPPLSLSSTSKNQTSPLVIKNSEHISKEEDIFGPTLEKRSRRKKRYVSEALKHFKQLKLFHFGVAASNLFQDVGRSAVRSVATLGIGLMLFNLLHAKINQKLDYKNRLLDNVQQRNTDQNFQVGIDPAVAPPFERRRSVKQEIK